MGKNKPLRIEKKPSVSHKRKQLHLLLTIVLIVLLVIVGLGFTIIWKNRTQEVVCTEVKVKQYNLAVKDVSNYAPKLKEIAEKVESKRGYEKNPTCVFIVYQHYAYVQNVDRSRQLLEVFKKLSSEGKQLPKDMLDVKSVEQMEKYVQSLEYNRSLGDDADDTYQ